MSKTAVVAAALALAACGGSSGPSNNLGASLAGSNEVPATTSTATGTAKYTVHPGGLSDGGTTIDYVITYSGLTGNPTASHIHVGAAGANGTVVVPFTLPAGLGTTGSFDGGFDASKIAAGTNDAGTTINANDMDSLLAAMRAGNTYTNIHTTQNKGGEIRGQNMQQ